MEEAWAARQRRLTAALLAALAAVLCLTGLLLRQHAQARPLLLQQTCQRAIPGAAAGGGGDNGSSNPLEGPAAPCLFNALLREEDVQWSEQPDGRAHQMSLRGCALRRFTHQEARQCLAGKRLVFLGDSVTRYQYVALAYFLERGRWPAPHGGVAGDPSPVNRHEWPSWNDFLIGTTKLLRGREECDCYRAEPRSDSLRADMEVEQEKFENRYFNIKEDNISVTFFSYTSAPFRVHGHNGFPPYPKGREPCAPGTCNATADWEYELAWALRKPVKHMQPTHLIINSGLWGSTNKLDAETWEGIANSGKHAVKDQRGRVFWKTTTAHGQSSKPSTRDHDAQALQAVLPLGWGVLDAFALTHPLHAMREPPYWDNIHFTAVVYRELNQYLLNTLCPTL